MRLPYFSYFEPASAKEALTMKAEYREHVQVIAGGTDVVTRLKFGLVKPKYVMSLKKIEELKGIGIRNGALSIGAMTPLTDLLSSAQVKERYRGIWGAIETVAAPPIRNVATLGGNICQENRCLFYNQSEFWRNERPPCLKAKGQSCLAVPGAKKCFSVYSGDIAPALIAVDAKVRLEKKGSSRTVTLASLFTGKGTSPLAIQEDELLAAVILPLSEKRSGSGYAKLRVRSSVDYPLLSVAVSFTCNKKGRVEDAQVVLGAVGPAPLPIPEARELFIGKKPSELMLDGLASFTPKGTQIINNLTVPAAYRKRMLPVFLKKAVQDAVQSLG